MSVREDDVALETLLAVAREKVPGFPESLIRAAYAIQRSHQFGDDGEREMALQQLQNLLDDHLKNTGTYAEGSA